MLSDLVPPHHELHTAPIEHLPLVRAAIDRLGIPAVVHQLLPQKPGQHVSDAHCVVAMLLNLLSSHGRIALYRIEDWLDARDPELLLGPGVFSHDFNDDRLAACLDHLFAVGYDDLLGRVVAHWLHAPDTPATFSLHQDTTSLLLQGAYNLEVPLEVPQPAHGFSKDHRPDLKQLIFGMSLQGGTGVPFAGMVFDGNTSDAFANRYHLDELAQRLPDPDQVTIVGDSKLVDGITLGELVAAGFHFVSLLPNNFALRQQLIEQVRGEVLPELRRRAGRKKADPPGIWCGRSFTRGLALIEPASGTRQVVSMRFLVVHSSRLAARFEAALPRRLKNDVDALNKAVRALSRRSFSCAADARKALAENAPVGKYHRVSFTVASVEKPQPYPGRGRPRKGQKRPVKTIWTLQAAPIERQEAAVEAARHRASHFVLVSDHAVSEEWSDTRLLEEYRVQSEVEGYTGFRWLKGPGAISPMFLKKPERIAGLGLVFLWALMVRNVVQFWLRRALAERDETLPGRNRQQTAQPTTEAAWAHFQAVGLIQVVHSDGRIVARHLTGLNPTARRILDLLGMERQSFTTPQPLPDGNSGRPIAGRLRVRDR